MDTMVATVQEWLNNTYSLGVTVDGVTGNATFTALIKALQTEIGVTADGNFGSGTLLACPNLKEVADTSTAIESNLIYILQGSFWCKGYNPGGFTGIFGPNTAATVKEFQADAGLAEDGIVTPYILQGIMNTDGYAFVDTDNIELNYKHKVQIGLNKHYGTQLGLIAPNGEWERKSHRNLIKVCQIEWGTSVDGVWGSGTLNAAPTLSTNKKGYTNSKRLLQWALAINGFYADNFDGNFNTSTKTAVTEFQELMELDADGIAGKNTWASLLVSYGSTSRKATAFDTSTRLTEITAAKLVNAGYKEVGRYLTNVENGTLDKKMTAEEIKIIEAAGLKVFPIYQTYGGKATYFTRYQGQKDAYAAKNAAQRLGFPSSTTIYFAVDYDALMADIDSNIIPYFRGINEVLGTSYKVGAYAPRAVCKKLKTYGLIKRSFVADMSSSFTGNIGVAMPSDWAYEQIVETNAGGIGIDKCIASSRSTAVSPSEFVTYDLDDKSLSEVEIEEIIMPFQQIYELAYEYLESLSSPVNGIYASVFNANELTLKYLRSSAYDYSSDVEYDITDIDSIDKLGIMWAAIAGARDSSFIQQAKKKYPDIVPEALTIVNPDDRFEIGVAHFAATMNAGISGTLSLYIDTLERDVDAFAGWAGDLMQLAAIVEKSKNNGYNYFNLNDLCNLIGATSDTLDRYHFFNDSGEEITGSGFGLEDFYQDIDSYNIARSYDLSKVKIYEAINDYYFGSKKYQYRYSIFKKNLLTEFAADSLYAVAYRFTNEEVIVMSQVFETVFGDFSQDKYGGILAQAFEAKINNLIISEPAQ